MVGNIGEVQVSADSQPRPLLSQLAFRMRSPTAIRPRSAIMVISPLVRLFDRLTRDVGRRAVSRGRLRLLSSRLCLPSKQCLDHHGLGNSKPADTNAVAAAAVCALGTRALVGEHGKIPRWGGKSAPKPWPESVCARQPRDSAWCRD